MSEDPAYPPYFQLSLLWMKDIAQLQRYREIIEPILSSLGATQENEILIETVLGDGVSQPTVAILVRFPSFYSFAAFQRDPRLRGFSELRRESFGVACVEGAGCVGDRGAGSAEGRQYLIEIARFARRDGDEYRRYEQAAAPIFARYGCTTRRVLHPDFTGSLLFRADIARVCTFEMRDGFERLQADPDFARLRDWYRNATRGSLWLVGSAIVAFGEANALLTARSHSPCLRQA